jgi:hypothetical protein
MHAFLCRTPPPFSDKPGLLPGALVAARTDLRLSAWTGFQHTVRAMLTVAQDQGRMNAVHHRKQEQSLDKIA